MNTILIVTVLSMNINIVTTELRIFKIFRKLSYLMTSAIFRFQLEVYSFKI